MKQILIVTTTENKFTEFADALNQDDDVSRVRTISPGAVLNYLSDNPPSLIIIDQEADGTPGLKIARDILIKNAMIHLALVSGMSEAEFHDTAEGLGVLTQLPPEPGAEQAKIVLEALKKLP